MNNWIIELEHEIGTDFAKLVVSLIALSITVATIVIGNWNILV